MNVIGQMKWWFGSVVERHPYTQNLVKRLLLELPWLLPHDKSYLGMRHLLNHANKLFLDVGANDGVSALSFRQIDKQRRYDILSIEPSRLHEPSLARIKRRDAGFDYRLVAAGDTTASLELFTPIYKSAPLHTAASLSLEQAQYTMATYMPGHVARNVRYEQQTVQVIPLDDLNLAPGMIKIDAEGFDDKVLRGLNRTIDECRPYILIERHPQTAAALDDFCERKSYMLADYLNDLDAFSPSTRAEARNVYCLPIERAASVPFATPPQRAAA
jgi:FkbM family methyltransferase